MKRDRFFSYADSLTFLEQAALDGDVVFLPDQSVLSFEEGALLFFPPKLFPPMAAAYDIRAYINIIPPEPEPYLIILAQAGFAALAFFEQGVPIVHRTISRYMVRKKQGKAQLSHLRKKGKSRYGSRLRLRESIRFFEDINRTLQEWETCLLHSETIFYSFPERFWNELYSSQVAMPLGRDDDRLTALPVHVNKPNYQEIEKVNYYLSTGRLQGNAEEVACFLERIGFEE